MNILSLDQQSYQIINEISNDFLTNFDKILSYQVQPTHNLEPILIYFFISKNHTEFDKSEFKIKNLFRSLTMREHYNINHELKIKLSKKIENKNLYFLFYHLSLNQILYKFKKKGILRTKPELIRNKFKVENKNETK